MGIETIGQLAAKSSSRERSFQIDLNKGTLTQLTGICLSKTRFIKKLLHSKSKWPYLLFHLDGQGILGNIHVIAALQIEPVTGTLTKISSQS